LEQKICGRVQHYQVALTPLENNHLSTGLVVSSNFPEVTAANPLCIASRNKKS